MDLKGHKIRWHWRICLGGVGWGLLSLWIPLAFPLEYFPRPSLLSLDLLRLFLPEGLAGFLLVVLLDRYISRAQEKKVRRTAGFVLCLISLSIPLTGTSEMVLHGGLFVASAACGLLIHPVVREIESPRQALTVFFWALVICAGGMMLGSAVLTVFQSFIWLRMISAAILSVGSTWLMAQRADIPSESKSASDAKGKAPAKLRLSALISFLCLLAVYLRIAQTLRDAASLVPLPLTAAPLLLAGLVYMSRKLILSRGLWRLVYVSFGCFALGVLCADSPLPGTYATYLPLFFYVAAAGALTGLCVYFICIGVSVYNRTLLLGVFFIVCLWLAQTVLQTGALSLLQGRALDPMIASVSAAFVYVAGPLLFIPLAVPGETGQAGPGALKADITAPPPEQPDETLVSPSYVTQFTGAEIKVYELILRGYTNQQIADALFISINTVKFHVKNILSKAGVNKRYKLYNAGRALFDI